MITQFTITIEFQTELFLTRREYVVASLDAIETLRRCADSSNYKVIGHNCQQVMTVVEVFTDIASERQANAKIARGER